MKKQKNQKLVLLFLVTAIVGLLIYYFYISKSNANIIQMREELKNKQSQLNELTSIEKKRDEVESKITYMENELEYINNKIPDYDCSKELTEEFHNLIISKKIKINTGEVTYPDSGKDQYGTSRISIQSTGSIEDIRGVVNYLKHHKRRLTIKMFSLQANPDNTYSASINVELAYIKK